jgi:hypothetical protein
MTELPSPTAPPQDGPPRSPLSRWLRTGGWKAVAGAAVGAGLLAGYSYFVGCRTGTCPLTSSVPTATAIGGVIGLLAAWPAPGKQGTRS